MLVAAVHIHRPDFRRRFLLIEPPPAEPFAVGTEKRPAIVAAHIRKALHLRAVRAHEVNVHQPRPLALEFCLLVRCQLVGVGMPVGSEGDPLTVRAVAALGVVPFDFGQIHRLPAGQRRGVDVVVLIVVPGVALLLSLGSVLYLRGLLLLRRRVGVSGGVEKLRAVRMQPRASRLARAVRQPPQVAGFKIEQVNLVKRISLLPLTLKDETLPVFAEVSFAGTFAGKGELPWLRKKVIRSRGCGESGEEQEGECAGHDGG